MYQLSTFDKLKIMYLYQNEYPLKANSRLNIILDEEYFKHNNFPYHNTQVALTRLTLIDFNLPQNENELGNFALKHQEQIEQFFENKFIHLYSTQAYIDYFYKKLEKKYLDNVVQLTPIKKTQIKL